MSLLNHLIISVKFSLSNPNMMQQDNRVCIVPLIGKGQSKQNIVASFAKNIHQQKYLMAKVATFGKVTCISGRAMMSVFSCQTDIKLQLNIKCYLHHLHQEQFNLFNCTVSPCAGFLSFTSLFNLIKQRHNKHNAWKKIKKKLNGATYKVELSRKLPNFAVYKKFKSGPAESL